MTEERIDRMEQKLDRLEVGQVELATQLKGVHDDLARRLGTLYEHLVDDIKALSLPVPELERRWRADDARLGEEMGRRLDPLEAAVRRLNP